MPPTATPEPDDVSATVSTTVSTTVAAAVAAAVATHRDEQGALLAVLQSVQAELGWLPPGVVPEVAAALNITRADVHGVVTFYPDLREQAPAPHLLRVCAAEACQAVGARDLLAYATERVSGDPQVELAHVFCLGNCALGPSAELDGRLVGRVGRASLDRLLEGTRA